MSLPTVDEVRTRIEQVWNKPIRLCLKFAYLAGARVSEVVGHAAPSDNTARGPIGTDVKIQDHNGESIAIFELKTAKRSGLERIIALPLEKEYEPWTEELLSYFQKRDKGFVFPFTRQRAWRWSRETFEGLAYPIESYTVKDGNVRIKVDRHSKPFATHALRHVRITDLIKYYDFSFYQVSLYAGWKMSGGFMGGGQHDRYAHLHWQEYLPKLLKKRY